MSKCIKDIRNISREIARNSLGNYPLLVLDTGGLIDFVESIKYYNLICKNGSRDSRYESISVFLKHLSENLPMIITPTVYQEICNHINFRLGRHLFEIPKKTVDFAFETMENSMRFISRLESKLEMDTVRYDIYWTSKLCCNGNIKKNLEGCSDADKEILFTAAYLSQCRTEIDRRKKIGKVLVISPDEHIIKGVDFLKKGFNGKYSNVESISTRS
ncbi:MAG: hypothetical protein QXX55_01180 [Candidatus Pacearchaeota archaeon]